MSDASQRKAIVAIAQAITTKSQAYTYASEVAQHAATLRATKLAAQAGEPAPIHSST